LGSRAWLRSRTRRQRDEILADLNVEMVGWRGSAGPVLVSFPRRRGALRSWAPAWLVQEALESGDQPGWRLRFLDPRWSLAAQVVLHASRVAFGTDNDRFVDLGIPAVFFSASSESSFDPNYHSATDLPSSLDNARLERWASFLASLTARIDRFEQRPPWRPSYLVIDGRLVGRNRLVILMFLALAPLSLRLIRAARHSPLGRGEILALCFAALSLAALILAPVLAPWLLAPAALAIAFTRGECRYRWLLAVLAAAPLALLWGAVLVATLGGLARGWGLPLHTTLVFTAAVGCAMASILEVEWGGEAGALPRRVLE
ncbi:MAG TPA: M28 family peptidase, partial [Thermoanaerobaculia bacterium]|nr:M28 family peptidase [Thermoanaerobaculia bacterium]